MYKIIIELQNNTVEIPFNTRDEAVEYASLYIKNCQKDNTYTIKLREVK